MNAKRSSLGIHLLTIVAICCATYVPPSHAQTSVLNVGPGTVDWFDASAWSNGVANGAGQHAEVRLAPNEVGGVTLGSPATLEELLLSGRGTLNFTGIGPLNFAHDGAGELLLRLTPDAGDLNVAIAAPLAWAPTELLHADVAQQGTLNLNGPIGVAGGLAKTGAGTLRLAGANAAWAGDLEINGGVVIAGNAYALGAAAGVTTIRSGGRLVIEHSTVEPLKIDGGVVQIANKDLIGTIEISGSATIHRPRNPVVITPRQGEFEQTLGPTNIYSAISGAGDLTIQNQSIDPLWLRGNNSYTGHTYITAGTVNATTSTALGAASEGTTVSGGNLVVQAATNETFHIEAGSLRFIAPAFVPSAPIEVAGGDVYFQNAALAVSTPIVVDGGNGGISGPGWATSFTGGSSGVGNLRVSKFSVDAPLAHHGDLTIADVKLNVANNYTGATIVTGEAELNHAGALGQSQQVVVKSGRLRVNALPSSAVPYAVEGGTLSFVDASQPVQSPITLGGTGEALLTGSVFQGPVTVVPGRRNRISGGAYNGSIGGTGSLELSGTTHLNAANSLEGAVQVAGGNIYVNHADALKASHTSVSGGTLHFNVPVNGNVLINQDSSGAGTVAFDEAQEIDAPWVLNAGTLAINAATGMDRLITIGSTEPAVVAGSEPLRIDGELTNVFNARLEGTIIGDGDIRSIGSHLIVQNNLQSFTGKLRVERGDVTVYPTTANGMAGEFHVSDEGTLSFFGDQFTEDIVVTADIYLHNAKGDASGNQGGLYHDSYASTARFLGRIDVGDEESVTVGNLIIEGQLTGNNLTHRGSGLTITSPQTGLLGTLRVDGAPLLLEQNGSLHGLEAIQLENRGELWLRSSPSAAQDRVGEDVPVASRGGRIHLYKHITAISPETLGTLDLQRGTTQLVGSQETPLTILNLQRERGTVLEFGLHSGERGVKLPNASLQFNGMLGGWAVTETGFATLGADGAFRTLSATKTSFAGAAATDHVKVVSSQTLTGDLTVASVMSQNSDLPVDLGGHRLQVASGGIFEVGKISNGILTAGVDGAPAELVVHHGREIAASIQDNAPGGAVSLVIHEGGAGLSGANSYTGGTWVVSSEDTSTGYDPGQLRILSYAAIPQNDRVHVDGALYTLEDLPAGTAHLGELHVRGGGKVRSGIAYIDADKIFLEKGQVDATLTGDGEMFKRTDGILDFANSTSPNFTGVVTVEDGRMLLQHGSLPQASFVLKGGVTEFSSETGAMAAAFTLDGGAVKGGRLTGDINVISDSFLLHEASTQVAGTLRGAGDLTIRGRQDNRFSYNVLLAGNGSQYSGDFHVESGALRINAPGSAGSGDIEVQSAGRLILGPASYSSPTLQVDNDVHLYGGTLFSSPASSIFATTQIAPSRLNGDLTVHGEGYVGALGLGLRSGIYSPGLTLAGKVKLEDGAHVFGLSDGRHSLADGDVALVDVAGQLLVGEQTTWNLLSSSVSISGEIRAAGTSGAIDFVSIPGQLRWTGADVIAGAGQTLQVTVNGGDAPLRLNGGGNQLAGNGTLRGDFLVTGGASVAPGTSPGKLTVDGDLAISSGGLFKVELGGVQPGTNHDQLIVTGQAAISGGLLDLSLVNGFLPQVNDMFTLLQADSLSGMFANAAGLKTIADGWRVDWSLNATGGNLVLQAISVEMQGDFNGNGVVDGDDLVLWKAGYGTSGVASHAQGDANGDGSVDGADLLVWQRQNGSIDAPPATANVPEPASAAMLLTLGLSLVISRRRPLKP